MWAFYCPFNPERKNEVLDYTRIVERLEHPVRFGLGVSKAGGFLNSLKLLEGCLPAGGELQAPENPQERATNRNLWDRSSS